MAINKNHEFEDLDGIKCSIVERNASAGRVEFLKNLLEFNGYTVVVVASPPPKAAAPAAPKPAAAPPVDEAPAPPPPVAEVPPAPSTFTLGVTDVRFNPTNAIFGRLLQTPDRHVVTLGYWQQKEEVAQDEIPYFQRPEAQN
jgi:hypothetical protein